MKYLLMAFMAAACCSVGCERREASKPYTTAAVRVKDPVCGMMVDKSSASKSSTWEGTKYYFCSKECADKFDQAPGTYLEVK